MSIAQGLTFSTVSSTLVRQLILLLSLSFFSTTFIAWRATAALPSVCCSVCTIEFVSLLNLLFKLAELGVRASLASVSNSLSLKGSRLRTRAWQSSVSASGRLVPHMPRLNFYLLLLKHGSSLRGSGLDTRRDHRHLQLVHRREGVYSSRSRNPVLLCSH